MERKYYIIYSNKRNSVLELNGKSTFYDLESLKKELEDYKNAKPGYCGDWEIITKIEHIDPTSIKKKKEEKGFSDFN
jgi:hypothetical protein